MTTNKKLFFSITLGGALSGILWALSAGPDPRNTGAPGDSGPNACAASGCHTNLPQGGPVNPAGGKVTATFSTGNVYYPGVPVVITVEVSDPVNRRYGFQMTARPASDLSRGQAGSFTPADSSTFVLCEDNVPRDTPGRTGTCRPAAPVEFIEHTTPSTRSWQFTWTPSENQSGAVNFYVAGNAVNFNQQSDGGDHVYTANYVLNPVACTLVVPQILSINSASDFGGLSTIAAGTWIEIKGTNLAPSVRDASGATQTFRSWEGRDFLLSNAPTSLDGVRVTVNDKLAFVSYVSPTQVNIQSPTDTITGNAVAVRVSNCSGTSAAVSVQKLAVSPGLLAHPLWKVGGKQYLTALHTDGRTFVGNTDLVQGVTLRPAKPGDTVTAYGIGFGDVRPASISLSGVIVPVQPENQILSSFNLTLGTTAVTQIPYKGLAPGFIGLYQINFVIPDVPDGDHQVNGTLAGTAFQQPPMFLTVKR
jgi:uncharacterized protein (TIGR03437 family)